MKRDQRPPLRTNGANGAGASPTLKGSRVVDTPADDLLDADLEDGDILTL